MTDTHALQCATRALGRDDLYFFTRFMFKRMRGYKWVRSWHQQVICDALMRVFRGECKRLIINVPPRYSKCSPRGTLISTPNGQRDIAMISAGDTVYSHDNGQLVTRRVKATETYRKACVTIRSKSGRTLRVSGDHPILTQRGWIDAQNLTDDHYLIRVCKEIDGSARMPDAELDFVTLMLFEGGCSGKSMIRFTSADPEIMDVLRASTAALGIDVKQYPSHAAIDYHIMGGASGIAGQLLVKHGMAGCLARVKRLPPAIFNLPLDQKYRFLSLMFATDGYVIRRHGQLGIALASEPLIDDIALLLDSCGVPSRKYVKPNDCAGAWELVIGASHIKRLAGKVDLLHKQSDFLAALEHPARESTIFGYPYDAAKGQIYRCKQVRPKIDFKNAGVMISDAKLERMIDEIDASLERWKMRDFIYDRVACVTPSGDDDVFHLEIDEQDYDAKNYIANGYVVHNTEIAVVNWMAWCLGRVPDSEFIHVSYSAELAENNSLNAQAIMSHEAYAEVFDTRLASTARAHWTTDGGGVVRATGNTGTLTGFGAGKMRDGFGGAIIIDDPHKPNEAESDQVRASVINWFKNTLQSRTNSPDTPIIVIMQRLHESDLSGWLLAGENGEAWDHLSLPAMAPDGEYDALWPWKHDAAKLLEMEKANPYVFAGQYQQRPAPLGGGILKSAWWGWYNPLARPRFIRIVQSWDTAYKAKETNDFTVCTTWGETATGFYLLDMLKDRMETPVIRRAIISQAAKWKPNAILIEDKASGQSLIQDVRADTRLPVIAIQVTQDKVARAQLVAPIIESGRVYLPEGHPEMAKFVVSAAQFPNATHDDDVDSVTQALAYMTRAHTIQKPKVGGY